MSLSAHFFGFAFSLALALALVSLSGIPVRTHGLGVLAVR